MNRAERKKQRVEYAVNAILNEAEKNNCYIVGITSSLELDKEIEWLCKKCSEKCEMKDKKVQVVALKSISQYAEALEEARTCDSVVLLEKYLFTTYKSLENMLHYLKKAEIKVLGVVNLFA